MAKINIDDKEYDFDALPAEAKAQIISLQFVDAELNRLGALTASLKTARIAYLRALQAALQPSPSPAPFAGDTIRLG